jgi:hypothetical protein
MTAKKSVRLNPTTYPKVQTTPAGKLISSRGSTYTALAQPVMCSRRERHRAPASSLADRGFAMAETTKLSVGKALEKLSGTEPPASRMARLDEKMSELDEETRRLRATRLSVERNQQQAGPKAHDAREANKGRIKTLAIAGTAIGIAVVIVVLVLMSFARI